MIEAEFKLLREQTIIGAAVCVLFRCVSGKRLCSGCSEPLGKGAAMIIDTLGLFFHMQCFKVLVQLVRHGVKHV